MDLVAARRVGDVGARRRGPMLRKDVRWGALGAAVAGAALLAPATARAQCLLSPAGFVDVQPLAVQGQAFTSAGGTVFTASGGAGGSYDWTGPQNTNGLSLEYFGVQTQSTNWIFGTPTQAGNIQTSVGVVSSEAGCVQGATTNITIHVCASPMTLTPPDGTTLPAGSVGTPYTQSIQSSLAGTGYWWTVTGLPPGLAMAQGASNFETNPLSGTPTAPGTYSIAVSVSDDPYFNPVDGGPPVPQPGCPAVKATYTLVVAGGVEAGTEAGGPDAAEDATCLQAGAACGSSADCCGGLACGGPSKVCCVAGNGHCSTTADCCAQTMAGSSAISCVGGSCEACGLVGDDCSTSSCCGGLHCLFSPGGTGQCCVPTGGSCVVASDCCFINIDTVSTCVANKCVAQPAPEAGPCGTGAGAFPDPCQSDSDCCSGWICIGQVCGRCLSHGAACNVSNDCCQGECVSHQCGETGGGCNGCKLYVDAGSDSGNTTFWVTAGIAAAAALGVVRRRRRKRDPSA
jgi:hypothetical protein